MPMKKKKASARPQTDTKVSPESAVQLGEWDAEVSRRTANFRVDGTTIVLKIGSSDEAREYEVSKSLLANRLPEFSNMMAASVAEPVVTIHNDARDFEDFLWFIHVDPLGFICYTKDCPSTEKFRRALGIGIIANFYNAADITLWAIGELLEHIDKCMALDLVPRLHRFAEDCSDLSPALKEATRNLWRRIIQTMPDPVAGLLAAREVNDECLQAHAYHRILQLPATTIPNDSRLNTLDRFRLALGSLNLRLIGYGLSSSFWNGEVQLPSSNGIGVKSPWDIFTHSAMGFSLADGSPDLSILAMSPNPRQSDEHSDQPPVELVPSDPTAVS